jgi:hypothetical protein
MKNIKHIYWVLTCVFLISTVIVSFLIVSDVDNRAGVFLSGLAIVFAILAMGLSDQKLPKFNGVINLWITNRPRSEEEAGHPFKLSIRIENLSSTPVNDIKIKIRTPSLISSLFEDKNSAIKVYKHGKTSIYLDDSFGILGTSKDNDYLHYDLKLKFLIWKEDHLWLTINGSNIKTTSWCIKYEQKDTLLKSTDTKPYQLN